MFKDRTITIKTQFTKPRLIWYRPGAYQIKRQCLQLKGKSSRFPTQKQRAPYSFGHHQKKKNTWVTRDCFHRDSNPGWLQYKLPLKRRLELLDYSSSQTGKGSFKLDAGGYNNCEVDCRNALIGNYLCPSRITTVYCRSQQICSVL